MATKRKKKLSALPNYASALTAAIEGLAFYANPETYHAMTIVPDRPSGEFADDFSRDHGHWFYRRAMPGAKAREVLKQIRKILKTP